MTSEMDTRLIGELGRRGVPIVFMDVGQVGPRMSHVSIDYGTGIRHAVDHLVALGHRDIGFISGPLDLGSARARHQGYLDGMAGHALEVDRRFIREGTHTAEGGQSAMTEVLTFSRLPTAMIASNDLTAIGALHAIIAAGLRVPEDVSLVGFDDIPLVRYTNPALTTVRLSAADVGTQAFQALFGLLGGMTIAGDACQVATRLVVRGSTAPPVSARSQPPSR
jgi:LacI family transcriptional regulator